MLQRFRRQETAGRTTSPGSEIPAAHGPAGDPAVPLPDDPRWDARRTTPKSRRTSANRQRVMAGTVVDQAASSASNFGLAFLVAHDNGAHALGIFAIVSATYIISQMLVRSLTSDCLLTRHDSDEVVMSTYERSGFLSAIACASGVSVVVLVVSLAFSGDLRLTFTILALSFPLLAAQDFARFIGISRYSPSYAVWLDSTWLFLFIVAYVVLRHQGLVSLPYVYGAWSAAGAAVGLYTLWNHLPRRAYRQLVAFWFRSERSVGFRFAGQTLIAGSWAYSATYLFILLFSLSAIGEFKLAQVVFGPGAVLTQGIITAMVALAARYFRVDVRKALRFVLLGGLANAAVMIAWMVVLSLAPVHTMTKVFGPAWPGTVSLVPLVGLLFALLALQASGAAGLRALRAARAVLRVAIINIPITFASCTVAGVLWGLQAALAGLCVGTAVAAGVTWAVLLRHAHALERELAVQVDTDAGVADGHPPGVGSDRGVLEDVVVPSVIADATAAT